MARSRSSFMLALGVLGIASVVAGCSKSGGPTTTTAPATTSGSTSPPTTTVTTTTVTPTTSVSVPPYPKGELGDKDFAVQSIQEHTEGLDAIGGTIRITNVGSKSYTLTFTVAFFATKTLSGQPLGYAQGSADGVAPGQTVTEVLVSEIPMFSQSNFYYEFQIDTEF